MLFKIDGFGSLSAIVVYNDAACHVTQFWPPDWLLLCTSGIPRCKMPILHKCFLRVFYLSEACAGSGELL